MSLYVFVGVFVFILAMGLYGRIAEKREWNGGVCRENGLPWEYFDSCSSGDRGYKAGDRICWIGWPDIDRRK